MLSYLPNPAVIICLLKIEDMIRISELGGVDPESTYLGLCRLVPSAVILMCRYELDMEGFGARDKFLMRAVCETFACGDTAAHGEIAWLFTGHC
jgi:hypothetical protein